MSAIIEQMDYLVDNSFIGETKITFAEIKNPFGAVANEKAGE